MLFQVFVRDLCGFKGNMDKKPASLGHQGAGLLSDSAAEQRDLEKGYLTPQTAGEYTLVRFWRMKTNCQPGGFD